MPNTGIIPVDAIAKRITFIRGQRVIIDADLAQLYGVSTSALNQAVKRNRARFPDDFMFQLSGEEFDYWKSQIVISNSRAKMGLRKVPYAFTEHGGQRAQFPASDRRKHVHCACVHSNARSFGDTQEYCQATQCA